MHLSVHGESSYHGTSTARPAPELSIQDTLDSRTTIPLLEGLKIEKLSLAKYKGDQYALW